MLNISFMESKICENERKIHEKVYITISQYYERKGHIFQLKFKPIPVWGDYFVPYCMCSRYQHG